MTVKSLSSADKSFIVHGFVHENKSLDSLATTFNRSKRTIIRVLEEKNVDPGIKKRAKRVKPVPVVIPTKAPWWRRIFGLQASNRTDARP